MPSVADLSVPPDQLGYLVVNWTVPLLQDYFKRESSTLFSDDTIRRALHRLGFVWKRYRYVLSPDPELEKKARFVVSCVPYHRAVWCWPKMKLICSTKIPVTRRSRVWHSRARCK